MPVIAFANSKGGSGKTTSALLLAQALAAHRPTTLIDADPRHPITTWAEKPGRPDTQHRAHAVPRRLASIGANTHI